MFDYSLGYKGKSRAVETEGMQLVVQFKAPGLEDGDAPVSFWRHFGGSQEAFLGVHVSPERHKRAPIRVGDDLSVVRIYLQSGSIWLCHDFAAVWVRLNLGPIRMSHNDESREKGEDGGPIRAPLTESAVNLGSDQMPIRGEVLHCAIRIIGDQSAVGLIKLDSSIKVRHFPVAIFEDLFEACLPNNLNLH